MLGISTKPALVPTPMDECLATLAHELRDPLATILFALEAISGDGDPAARQARTIVERQARRASRIVDDLFDFCAGSCDRLSLFKEVVELAAIVAGATETTAHLLAARGHRLTVSLPAEPVFLVADPLRLEQVLTNLLANAAKFTGPGGHIRLTAEAEAGLLVLRVRDNGRGIAPDLLPRIFDPFRQGPGLGEQRFARTRARAGPGEVPGRVARGQRRGPQRRPRHRRRVRRPPAHTCPHPFSRGNVMKRRDFLKSTATSAIGFSAVSQLLTSDAFGKEAASRVPSSCSARDAGFGRKAAHGSVLSG